MLQTFRHHVLRGPRPPSEKWLQRKRHSAHTSPGGGDSRSPTRSIRHNGVHPSALGETSPHAKSLVEALRIARAKFSVPLFQQRIQSCKLYIERSKQGVAREGALITRAVEQKAICWGGKLQTARRDSNNFWWKSRHRHRRRGDGRGQTRQDEREDETRQADKRQETRDKRKEKRDKRQETRDKRQETRDN